MSKYKPTKYGQCVHGNQIYFLNALKFHTLKVKWLKCLFETNTHQKVVNTFTHDKKKTVKFSSKYRLKTSALNFRKENFKNIRVNTEFQLLTIREDRS